MLDHAKYFVPAWQRGLIQRPEIGTGERDALRYNPPPPPKKTYKGQGGHFARRMKIHARCTNTRPPASPYGPVVYACTPGVRPTGHPLCILPLLYACTVRKKNKPFAKAPPLGGTLFPPLPLPPSLSSPAVSGRRGNIVAGIVALTPPPTATTNLDVVSVPTIMCVVAHKRCGRPEAVVAVCPTCWSPSCLRHQPTLRLLSSLTAATR